MSEDAFTSVQWDRGEPDAADISDPAHETIAEENEDSETTAVPGTNNETASDNNHSKTTEPAVPEPAGTHPESAAASISSLHSQSSDAAVVPVENTASGESGGLGDGNEPQDAAKNTQGASANDAAANIINETAFGASVEPAGPNYAQYGLVSTVSSPIRDLDTASKPYISYLVTTQTAHPAVVKLLTVAPDGPDAEITVRIRRRYGDFSFLHDCLSNDYPQVLVPPLPSKLNFKYLTGDTFSTPFVHRRLHSLDRFIRFIASHTVLRQLAVFHLFVSDLPEWNTFTKNLKITKGAAGPDDPADSSGFVNKVVNDDVLTDAVMNFLTPAKHKRETNKDILEISDKLKKLYENLIRLDRIFSKLNKKNHDLSADYGQFLAQISKLAVIQNATVDISNDEESVLDPNESFSGHDAAKEGFTNNFKVFSKLLDFFLQSWGGLHKYVDESFLVALKDCLKYIVALTNLIELQHSKKIDLQVLQDYLVKTRAELASVGGGANTAPPTPVVTHSGGLVNNTTQLIKDTLSTQATSSIGLAATDGKKNKLQARVDKLEKEIQSQTALVQELTNKIIHEEYPNWDRFNKNELKESMLGLCDQEIGFYRGLVDNWSEVEVKLAKRLEELK